MTAFAGKLALVTGASRGIGAAVAGLLAERGADVVINYRNKQARAETVAAAVRASGRQAHLAQADLTSAADLGRLAAAARQAGPLDLVILNASGGLEKDQAEDYALRLNRDAQVETLARLLPEMRDGATVVFVTSHWAHFYGRKPVYPGYEVVAASKRAGEDALRERMPELAARGIRLLVVSGDAIDGTITPRLLERSQPGLLAARRSQVGALPTVAEFAAAIVDSISDPALASGDVVFVGAIDETGAPG